MKTKNRCPTNLIKIHLRLSSLIILLNMVLLQIKETKYVNGNTRYYDVINCSCGITDWQKAFRLTSRFSNIPWAGYEPAQDLSLGFVEWICAEVIITTPQRHKLLTLWVISTNHITVPRRKSWQILWNWFFISSTLICLSRLSAWPFQ